MLLSKPKGRVQNGSRPFSYLENRGNLYYTLKQPKCHIAVFHSFPPKAVFLFVIKLFPDVVYRHKLNHKFMPKQHIFTLTVLVILMALVGLALMTAPAPDAEAHKLIEVQMNSL